MKHRILCCLLAISLVFSVCPALAAQTEAVVDRYDEVFDPAQDAGRLTARFLVMQTTSEEKPGDCTLLTSPDGKIMLLDAGEPTALPYVMDALHALGITRIDCVVASHPHIDHIGGLADILQNFEVGTVYTSELWHDTATYARFMQAMDDASVPHVILKTGDTLAFGEKVRVDVLWPPSPVVYYADYPNASTSFINDHSLALKFTFGQSTFLFAGDLYVAGEKEVVARYGDQLQADVLKVNHHGAATSSCKAWRTAVDAKLAVMMHDGLNDLGVYQKYRREDTQVFVTFLDGCVKISTSGDATYDALTQWDRASDFLD
ncbi:MAG: MBL fold metallo-hydrolase [Clostridia bacterium]